MISNRTRVSAGMNAIRAKMVIADSIGATKAHFHFKGFHFAICLVVSRGAQYTCIQDKVGLL